MRLSARVDVTEALSYLGYAGQEIDGELSARLERAVNLVNALSAQGMVRTLPIEGFEAGEGGEPCLVRLAGSSFALEGRDIAHHVRGAREVALMVVTLGLESESLLRRETVLNPTDGLLVDACASSLVESAANELSRLVAERASERGLRAGSRFSPGYGDFPLSAQCAFLDAVGASKALGVSVTRGDLLVPSKSITAVAGLYAECGARPGDAAEPAGAAAAGGGVACVATADGDMACANGSTPSDSSSSASVPPPSQRRCETCKLAETCILRAQGRTCYGRL